MNNYTDTQLKQALAKMLPEEIGYEIVRGFHKENVYACLWWLNKDNPKSRALGLIKDTELLHLCWLVEQGLCEYTGEHQEHYSQRDDYSKELMKLCGTWNGSAWDWGSMCDADLFQAAHATWQQRVIALAKVKGVEIV